VGTFDDIKEALHYVVFALAKHGHMYIINVRGPMELSQAQAPAIQVVPATFVHKDRDLGLAIHMPFAPTSRTFSELDRFLDEQGYDAPDEYQYKGKPILVINLGENVTLATRVLEYILERVYGYPFGTAFQCEVYDEGVPSW
jgi:hypothetical protein